MKLEKKKRKKTENKPLISTIRSKAKGRKEKKRNQQRRKKTKETKETSHPPQCRKEISHRSAEATECQNEAK